MKFLIVLHLYESFYYCHDNSLNNFLLIKWEFISLRVYGNVSCRNLEKEFEPTQTFTTNL